MFFALGKLNVNAHHHMPTPKNLLYRVQRIRHFYFKQPVQFCGAVDITGFSGRRQGGKIGWVTYNSECGHISLWEGNYLNGAWGKQKTLPHMRFFHSVVK